MPTHAGVVLDRNRFSVIGHRGFRYWNPVNPEFLDAWIDQLPLQAGHKVLDIGCGRAELLVRAVERHGVSAVGFDTSPLALDLAREALAARVPDARVALHETAFSVDALKGRRFELVTCVGSTHAVGGLEEALDTLGPLLHPGGSLLLGEGYWKTSPDPAYLEAIGASADDLLTHAGNLDLMRARGFDVLAVHETDSDAWDHYEDTYSRNLFEFIDRHPADPDVDAMRDRIQGWREAFLRWGRVTMGFGLYHLARRTEAG